MLYLYIFIFIYLYIYIIRKVQCLCVCVCVCQWLVCLCKCVYVNVSSRLWVFKGPGPLSSLSRLSLDHKKKCFSLELSSAVELSRSRLSFRGRVARGRNKTARIRLSFSKQLKALGTPFPERVLSFFDETWKQSHRLFTEIRDTNVKVFKIQPLSPRVSSLISQVWEKPGKILPTRHFYFRSPEQRNVCRCNLLTRVQCDESLGERLKFRGGIQSTRDVSNVSVFEILLELLCRRSDKWNRIFTRSSSLLPRNATRKINQRQGSVSKCCVLRVRRQRVENDSSACRCCASRTHAWPMAFNLEISSKFVSRCVPLSQKFGKK